MTEQNLKSIDEEVYVLPTSFAQQRLWFLDQFEPNSPFYNIPTAVRFKGNLNVPILEKCINEIIRRHETLRTTFDTVDGKPSQIVHPYKPRKILTIDISGLAEKDREQETFRLAGEEARTPFDLRRGPLLRATLIKVGAREHVVLITMHHIISDGWSMGVFVREIAALYDAFSHGRPSPLPELEIQYGDFAAWQEEYIAGEVLENQLGYWKKQLGGDLPVLEIPADRPRPAVQTARGDNEDIVVPGKIANAIRNLARREGATLFMALTAAFQTLLYRYTGLEDVLIGSPIANRNRAEIESLIGFFVNTLVLRTDLSGNPTFRKLLQRVKKVTLEAYDNQDVPFERLVEVLQPNRDMSHSPLFQVMFILQNAPMKVDVEISDVALSSLNVNAGTSTYDLTLMVTEQADGFSVSAEYNTDLYDASTIRRLLLHFQDLLAAMAGNPDHRLSSFPILTEEEKNKLLVEWNDYSRDFPESVVIHQLFEEQVARTPDAVAVVFDDEYLTFGELNRRANKLARHLVGLGVGPDVKVSICIDKGLDLPVAVLGTLKAGGAYVPVDPTYPKDRIAYMIGDSNALVVLTNKELHSTLPFGNVPVVLLDEHWPTIEKLDDENLAAYPDSDNLAYMIYTSGSTGKSKGTMVSHKSIVNAYLAWEKDYHLRSDVNSHLQMASFSFDVFGGDFVRALCSGGKLVLCPRDFLLDAEKLYRLMVQEKVNCAEFVPAVLRNLVQYLDESGQRLDFMRALIAGSDVWYVKEYKKFLNYCGPETRLINSFGLTEAAVDSTFFEGDVENYPDERLVPIGRPFANSKIYIVDKNFNITPVGIPGELCVAGPNLARGYYKRPDLTAEKFIPNPFSDVPGARLYRTGDLARFLSDGNIEFLGRIDHQIKIRGFRIELGEIETVLEKYSEIKSAVILAREDKPGDKRLVAYVVPKNEHEPDIADVRSFLKEQLPDYMLPSAIVVLDALPLTPNGKVDRKALPAPGQKDFDALQKYVAPETETEQNLAEIWADILGLEKVGIEDNFFELGGHSLLATQVISRIRDTFHIDLPLRNLFEYVKIVDLAHAIDKAAGAEGEEAIPPITPMAENTVPVLSFAQERLWFLDQLEPNSPFYNIPEAVRIHGPLDIFRLEACFNEIIRRHESLRTNFREENGRPVLVISPEAQVDIHVDDLQILPNPEREIEALRIAQFEAQRPFDLARGSLFRVHVLNIDHEDYMLLLTIHHIISDDWSTQVLVGELVALYETFSRGLPSPLPELPIQYSDFAWWQRNWLRDEVLEEQLNYWKNKLTGSSPVLELPTDRPRPAMQTANGSYKTFRLSEETTKKLYAMTQREGVTIFMTLLAAFNVLLYRYSGQDDINIGTPIANRNRGELESLIGFFVNTLVLRSDLSGNPSFRDFLKRVRETALGAYAHQDLPFEKIVDALNVQRDMSHSPLFQVMFALQNTPSQVAPVESEIRISPVEAHSGTAKFDLTLFMLEEGETLSGAVEFNTDLFDDMTIDRMIAHFKKIVESVVSDPQQLIASVPMVTLKELKQVLVDWNGKRVTPLIQKNIKQIFEEQAGKVPNNIALQFDQDRMTYFELNRRANLLAHRLIKAGVSPDVLVGICIERSVEMIVAILAVLKAGGAYVPLDPSYPEERLSYILHDSNVPVLLTKQDILETLPESEALMICVDTEWEEIEYFDETDPKVDLVPENLAYMIYTSGSTGKPKGTLITHRGLSNYLDWTYRAYPLHEGRGSLVHSTIAFDATVTAVFTPILTGKTITLIADDADLEALGLALRRYRDFNIVKITPAHLELLSRQIPPEEASTLASAFVIGGENLTGDQIAFWQKNAPDTLLFNEYGPTETVVGCVVFESLKWRGTGSVPIGRTVPNMQVYVLDEHLQPVPAGVPGELYIAGEGVARGYHNRPDLTGERFLPDPYSEISGARMYKTGDLVRYLNDGNLIFLGRVDNQVKIRGYRIELGEIESVLQQMEGVENVITIVREDTPGDKRLVAYFTTGKEAALSVDDLRIFIKEQLPDYMVPAAFVKLDAFPLTANGKIDHKALPKPDYTALQVETEFVAPRTGEEELLAGLWQDILNLEKVGIHDNFFELGGHSLLATQVISRIRDTFEVELPLRALFEAPTIASLLIHIEKARMQADGSAAPPLKRIPRDDELPLSFAQQRLWFLDQLAPDNPFYNIPAAIRLTGSLNITALENSINEIIRRHEVLRTIFKDERGRPVAVIQPQLKIKLEMTDLTHLHGAELEKETLRLVTKDAMQPFKLDKSPLFRTGLIKTGWDEYVILFTMHHIVSDGWSTGVLMREVGALYEAFSRGAGSPLPELPVQYADYAAWQRNWLKDDVLEQQLKYWKKTIGVNPPILDLPTDHPRPAMQTFNGAFVSTQLPFDVSQGLNYLSRKHGATLFMTLLAAFQTLLHHYTHQEEILVGSPIANRTHSETEALIGFFVNTLVLKADFSDDLTFVDLLKQIRKMTLGGYAHQDLPFERLVDELQPDRDMSHSPLFQAMFVLQNTPRGSQSAQLPSLRMQIIEADERTAKFDITLVMAEAEEGLMAELEYNTDLFDHETISRMLDHFRLLLQRIVSEPHLPVSQLSLISGDEQTRILQDFNKTETPFPADRCIHELFEKRVAETPDAAAVVFENETLTFAQLNERVNKLAHYLRGLGVHPEKLVGISVDRSVEMVVGLLCVLKSGGVYVPIDPTYPEERITYILQDAGIDILLTQAALAEKFSGNEIHKISLDTEWDEIASFPGENPKSLTVPENLAYMIYTSGSTGKPKGTMLQHRGLVNLTLEQIKDFQLDENCRALQFASFSFDASVSEIFTTLISGAALYLAPKEKIMPGPDLIGFLKENKITTITLPPSVLSVLGNEGFDDLRTLVSAGEACSKAVAEKWSVNRRFLNAYGPTENTVCASSFHVDEIPDRPFMPIGKPIGNVRLYILDEHGHIVPIGVPGELHIAGINLARGYYRRPDLTAQKFVPNPYSDMPGERLYKTGDLARFLPDGNIEFLGRIDHQVKLRGFRVELGEIEQVLLQHEAIHEVVVLVRQLPGRKNDALLVAYLVEKSDRHVSDDELRAFLHGKLPEYMLPSGFIRLDEIPLTANGKIDRKALPMPTEKDTRAKTEYVAPRNETEEMLADIWAETLGIERLGIYDNFFESGGHSLLATQLISRIREAFLIDLPISAIFESPFIESMAEKLEELKLSDQGLAAPSIVPVSRDQDLPLSFSQQRLWFLDKLDPGTTNFNLTEAVRLTGALDIAALEKSLLEIVRRHEVLRTTFALKDDGTPVQIIDDEAGFHIEKIDLSVFSADVQEDEVEKLAVAEMEEPFDLNTGPVVRTKLVKLDQDKHVFIITMHHIVSDGWSIGIFIGEVAALYQAFVKGEPSPLPELPVQYADFSYWQRSWLQGEVLEKQIAYWRNQLEGSPPVLELPTDRPRPAMKTFNGSRKYFSINSDLSKSLADLSSKHGVTPFMLMLAAFQTLLYRYSGQDDINVGSPIANRNRLETEKLIGFFVNTLVFRTDLSDNPAFTELLRRVRKMSLGAFAHQDVPFEKLVEVLQPERDLSHTPLFQVMLVFQNAPVGAFQLPDLEMRPIDAENNTVQFDLILTIQQGAQGLDGSFQFNTDLFNESTIARMITHFKNLLNHVAAHPDQGIAEIPMLTAEEVKKLTLDWNQTESDFYYSYCAHEIFEEQAHKTPDAPALLAEVVDYSALIPLVDESSTVASADFSGEQRLTYRELDVQANRLANYLVNSCVKPEDRVGICLDRSVEMVVSLLAVLKAGAAYVPLDPVYPKERLDYMIRDAGIKVILSNSQLSDKLPLTNADLIFLNKEWIPINLLPDTPPQVNVEPENLAYIIYTSGSTGKPKGVLLRHRGLCNLTHTQIADFQVRADSRVLQFASFSFDASVSEIFMALHSGASLYLAQRETLMSPTKLANLFRDKKITVVTLPPSMLALLSPQEVPGLETIVSAGEPCSIEMAALWSRGRRFVNAYGPTESTVGVSSYAVTSVSPDRKSIPIGKPISNTKLYILDRKLNPVPVGVAGELCIGSIGLARGYNNRPDLTAEKFLPNPFSSEPGARMYRTGDLAAFLQDGNIEFLGRIDNQVKVRGFRIELGEIEQVLSQHEGVRDAVVITRKTGGSQTANQLLAYVIWDEDVQASVADLRSYLTTKVPEYMVPNTFMFLDRFPLTPNGKVDRKKLPDPDMTVEEKERHLVPATDEVETRLVGMWEELLQMQPIGITDNFFDFGGHSLMAIQLLTRIKKDYDKDIPLVNFFKDPTIRGLSDLIRENTGGQKSEFAVSLVKFNDDNTSLPIFLVHPSGGSVHWYADLAKALGENRPVYGIQARGVNGDAEVHTTIEEMAAHNIKAMRLRQKEGPYFISSWSMGVVIVYEMTQQLTAQGEEIGLFAILDQGPILPGDIPDDQTVFLTDMFMGRLKFNIKKLKKLDYNEQLQIVLSRAKKVGLLQKDLSVEQFRNYVHILKVQMDAWRNYRAKPYDGKVLLLKSAEYKPRKYEPEDLGWSEFVRGGVDIKVVPGNHNTMLWQPNVKILADHLKTAMEKCMEVK